MDAIELSSLPVQENSESNAPGIHNAFAQVVIDRVDNHHDGQANVHVQSLPPMDRGRKAWTFCLSAFILEVIVWGFGFSYGIFQDYYTSHPPFNKNSPVAIAAVGSVALAIQYGEGLLLSLFFRRYPDYTKRTMWFGLALSSTSLFLSSFVSQVWGLILLQGVGFGIGGGMLYMPVIGYLSEWFVEKRGLAGGIIFCGSGVGGFLFPLMVHALLEKVGFRWTLRIWAIASAIIAGIALLGVQPRVPVPKFHRHQTRPRFIPPRMEFLKQPVFWTFSVTTVLQALSYSPVSLYIAMFTTSISSPLSATIVLSLFNSSGVAGQILVGFLSDRFPYPWIMFVSAIGSALCAFLLWGFASTLAQVFVFAILFGGLSGGFSSVWPAAASDSAGRYPEQSLITFTCFALIKGVAAIVGPILSGLLLESGESLTFGGRFGKFGFGSVEVFVGSCAVATSVASLVVAAIKNRAR